MGSGTKSIMQINAGVVSNGPGESLKGGMERLLLLNSGMSVEPGAAELNEGRSECPAFSTATQEIPSPYTLPGIQGVVPSPVYAGTPTEIPARYEDLIVTDITTDNFRLQWTQSASGTGRAPATTTSNASILTAWIV